MAVACVRAFGLALVPRAAKPGHLVFQEREATIRPISVAKLASESCIMASSSSRSRGSWTARLVPLLGSTFGRLRLVSNHSVRVRSFQGGSSSKKGEYVRPV